MEQRNETCLIYGCMGLGGGWNADPVTSDDEKKAGAAIHAALEIGIDTFDHADIYTFGKAEEVFGRVMNHEPGLRDKIILQSKTGIHLRQGPNNANTYNFSREYLLQQVGLILGRLQTDYLDILLLHRPDSLMNAEEVAETFALLKSRGLVRQFGVSNMSIHQIGLLQKYWTEPLVANQVQLSLGHSLALDIGVSVNTRLIPYDSGMDGMLEYCQLHDMAIQAYGPLDRGLYTDAHNDSLNDRQRSTARLVAQFAEEHRVTPSAIVLAWLLTIPGTVQPIIGTTHPDRILACRDAARVRLSRNEWYQLWITARGEKSSLIIFTNGDYDMYHVSKISFKDAVLLVNAVAAEAEKLGKHVTAAVCGPEGELISFLRMDGANPTSSVIAQNKAYTAARDKQETQGMGQWMRSSNTQPPFWGDAQITGFGGGVPIVIDGNVIGAIGVSGLSEDEDVQLAKAAITAVGEF